MDLLKSIFAFSESKSPSLEKLIEDSKYEKKTKKVLIEASKKTMEYKEFEKLKKTKTPLVIFQDTLLNKKWLIDLTKFVHPFGLGPDTTKFTSTHESNYDITSEFNDSPHDNSAYDVLLSKATHLII